MSSLTGQKIKDTYQSLLKTDDNGLITTAFKNITDGSGSASGLYLKNSGVEVSGSLTVTGSVDITGSLTVNTINVGQNTLNFIDNNGVIVNSLSATENNIVIATGSIQSTSGSYFSGSFTGSLQGTSSYALTASYAMNGGGGSPIDTSSFATTGSNTFSDSQTINGNLFLSGSFRLVYNNDPTTNMLFGQFDGSTIHGPYYQLFGNQYSNTAQRGGAEFVYDTRNGGDANFHISSFDGNTWTQKFRVDDNGVQITGSLGFGNNGLIESIPTSSGDGSNASILELKPDASLGTDQYIVLDPTSPNHIHIRAGGIIDASTTYLYLGGENTNVLVDDGGQRVQITTTNAEVKFIGYIDNGFGDGSGATLHVTNMINGTITDGMTIYGPGIPGGYTLQFGTVMAPQGDGGVGNYYLPGGDFLTTPSVYTGGTITTNNWNFDTEGNTLCPTLTTPRGDISSGDLTSNTLRLGDGTDQAIIGTPNGTISNPSSQRLIINPGQGSGSAEGGDVYLWAGRGGVEGGSGGDIKIRGGYGPITGGGGYVRIEGGNTADGNAGFVEIRGGDSNTAAGGDVDIYGGFGNSNTQNGNVTINTYDSVGSLKTWTFDTSGSLTIPGDTIITGSVDISGSLTVNGNVDLQQSYITNVFTATIDLSVGSYTITKPGIYTIQNGSTGGNTLYFPDANNFLGAEIFIINQDPINVANLSGFYLPYVVVQGGPGNYISTIGTSRTYIFKSLGQWFGGQLS